MPLNKETKPNQLHCCFCSRSSSHLYFCFCCSSHFRCCSFPLLLRFISCVVFPPLHIVMIVVLFFFHLSLIHVLLSSSSSFLPPPSSLCISLLHSSTCSCSGSSFSFRRTRHLIFINKHKTISRLKLIWSTSVADVICLSRPQIHEPIKLQNS